MYRVNAYLCISLAAIQRVRASRDRKLRLGTLHGASRGRQTSGNLWPQTLEVAERARIVRELGVADVDDIGEHLRAASTRNVKAAHKQAACTGPLTSERKS
jgi:hypothetical protein